MTRVAVVTGASGGIGRAVALELASSGTAVACCYHRDDAGAKETAEAAERAGGTAAAFAGDVSSEHDVEELFRQVKAWAGAATILVNNAGVSRDGLVLKYPLDAFEGTLRVNVTGAFLCSRAALPAMLRARWGRIVNVASVAALHGTPGQSAYAASKAAMVGMTRTLAREVGRRGVTVNAVCPGLVETDMTSGLDQAQTEELLRSVPSRRPGTTREIASVVAFLAGEEASYVNGAVVTVDGGMTA